MLMSILVVILLGCVFAVEDQNKGEYTDSIKTGIPMTENITYVQISE